MKLSTKGRYAVTALADIALQGPDALVSLADIARRQDISLAYLEQLFVKLRKAGVVDSVRGPGGGYRLAKGAAGTRISDVMTAVDERLNAMGCDGKPGEGCGGVEAACLTHALWEQLSSHVYVFLNQTTLADVVAGRMEPCPAVPDFTAMLEEEEATA
ncbi:MAG: Rrf2 family transcriptional regulator [Tropicimonas sp.]|uniref:Rrf2 family transcriptional regulator n=1 Tax=Tropicimonas sp. TaxID=2067044 RepID=UPI003A89AFC7